MPMSEQALWQLPATALQRRYRERSLTPLAVVQAVLARLDAVNPRLNAVVARRDAAVLAEAEASTRRFAEGRPLSALDGVPLTVKDSLFSADLPKTRSGKIMRRILRKIAANDFQDLGDTSTLADPAVVDDLVKNRAAT